MLNITKTEEKEAAVFELEGRLDTVTASELENALRDTLEHVNELTLDFEKLDYISSAGLRVLLSTHKALMNKGGMKIVHVCQNIMDIFDVTGFLEILTIE